MIISAQKDESTSVEGEQSFLALIKNFHAPALLRIDLVKNTETPFVLL